jgi:fumarylacetoacetate (FAA) hydrolase family protein
VLDPAVGGPRIVTADGDDLVDITDLGPTVSDLFERPGLAGLVKEAANDPARTRLPLADVLAASTPDPDPTRVRLLAPIDLQVIKAAGVTFVDSMIERVIEERAQGDASRADAARAALAEVIGDAISSIRPGSEQARRVKAVLQEQGLWSQYLEVGIGPDPEVFTKAPVLSAVGWGQNVGIRQDSSWNNPEPELVLTVRSDGEPVGATLGNDVNLRDIEGRSALLLGEAKDNNASCAIGGLIRLFDDGFTMDDVRALEISLRVEGEDGFVLEGTSSMSRISRDPVELLGHARARHHQYPDGFVLFTGTLFAPTQDRHSPGAGFTHDLGDVVTISTPQLGALTNTVTHSHLAPEWTVGIRAFFANLRERDYA